MSVNLVGIGAGRMEILYTFANSSAIETAGWSGIGGETDGEASL
jgi:hypothetical protein